MAAPQATTSTEDVLPEPTVLQTSRSKIISHLPHTGIGLSELQRHLSEEISPGLNRSSKSPYYYGFVTGGATPAAAYADNLVTLHDQNLSVHLPADSVATEVEDAALRMLCDLLDLAPADWPHRTFTTGATASNFLGLACAREYVVLQAALRRQLEEARRKGGVITGASVGEEGIAEAMRLAGVEEIQILTTKPHSSLGKAAAMVGLGRGSVKEIVRKGTELRFDLNLLRDELARPNVVSIVAVSCAEVNTGLFATDAEDMRAIRLLCDQYDAWLHVDAAFGLLARVLPATDEFSTIRAGVQGFELADSITGDAHKLLNVPYDSGIFLSRHLHKAVSVFQNPNAAYLESPSSLDDDSIIPSPANIGIENSRRFRALPVYAGLVAYGREWYARMLERQIRLARKIAEWIDEPSQREKLVLLPVDDDDNDEEEKGGGDGVRRGSSYRKVYMIVLFAARDEKLNAELVKRINSQRKIYVSGTQWEGRAAARLAVANWQVEVDRDFEVVRTVLEAAIQ